MGFLTTMMIYNDQINEIAKDEDWGSKVYHAVCQFGTRDRKQFAADVRGGKIVSMGHADHPQIIMAWQNRGYWFGDPLDQTITDDDIDLAIKVLKDIKRYRARKTA